MTREQIVKDWSDWYAGITGIDPARVEMKLLDDCHVGVTIDGIPSGFWTLSNEETAACQAG